MDDLREKRQYNPTKQGLEDTGLYHSFRLPDGRMLRGAMAIEHQEERLASFNLPEDLNGLRALDIGPWDGYYSFELERRGAEVVAIDYVDLDTFRAIHKALNSKVEYLQLDVYELDPAIHGSFDIVVFFGVLYHLKHPLLAMEKICAVTRGVCMIDTFVIDGEGPHSSIPVMEFYETGELGGQFDNWCGPSVTAVQSMARAAGFAQADIVGVTPASARVKASRIWRDIPPDETPAPEIVALTCHSNRGRTFQSQKEQYITLWCQGAAPRLENVYPEVDGLGVAPLGCGPSGEGFVVSVRVPPGLSSGRHHARVKVDRSRWSKPALFYLDLPAIPGTLDIRAAQDAITVAVDEVDWAHGGWLAIWVDGLSEEADAGNTSVTINGIPHYPDDVALDRGQINVRLRPILDSGPAKVQVQYRGLTSNTVQINIKGHSPAIRGLEQLSHS